MTRRRKDTFCSQFENAQCIVARPHGLGYNMVVRAYGREGCSMKDYRIDRCVQRETKRGEEDGD